MNWKDIKISADNTSFLYNNELLFGRQFTEVLKFHAPGIAPVKDETGSYHLTTNGQPLYLERYDRTFGFYDNRASVIQSGKWFHINEKGEKIYPHFFAWTGNFQENLCAVRDFENNYYHIDLQGNRIYSENYLYAGDFKDGYACVCLQNKKYKHIDAKGNFLNNREFADLGVFHKGFATAKDEKGWHHIDKQGKELYLERYLQVEPFYNGYALVTDFQGNKLIINELGEKTLKI